jgi:hypothetical protein
MRRLRGRYEPPGRTAPLRQARKGPESTTAGPTEGQHSSDRQVNLGASTGRVWLAWLFLTVVAVGDVMLALLQWPAWWIEIVLINGTMLALLLSRPTRRHARRGRPRLARLMP